MEVLNMASEAMDMSRLMTAHRTFNHDLIGSLVLSNVRTSKTERTRDYSLTTSLVANARPN